MSGLSWLTILRKRENFRAAFRQFAPEAMARFGSRDVARLMGDAGIVRNRAKIEATINNARRYAEMKKEFGSMARYVWGYEPPPRKRLLDRAGLTAVGVPAEAVAMSKDLRRRGWGFVGPTKVQSFMQAMGLVNDHLDGCDALGAVERARSEFVRPT